MIEAETENKAMTQLKALCVCLVLVASSTNAVFSAQKRLSVPIRPQGSSIRHETSKVDDIYVMNADGREVSRLTSTTGYDGNPSWSPDGKFIAYEGDREALGTERDLVGINVYTMRADGTGVTQLTRTFISSWNPLWAPDGKRIFFGSFRSGNHEIYSMALDGSQITKLTDSSASDWPSDISPDGKKLLFESNRDGNWEIYVMNIDGKGVTRLTRDLADDHSPGFSPDGGRIVFSRSGSVYTMNANGTEETEVGPGSDPVFSPDGKRILFVLGTVEIAVMNADGTAVTQLTDTPGSSRMPQWSPDGTKIVFVSSRDTYSSTSWSLPHS